MGKRGKHGKRHAPKARPVAEKNRPKHAPKSTMAFLALWDMTFSHHDGPCTLENGEPAVCTLETVQATDIYDPWEIMNKYDSARFKEPCRIDPRESGVLLYLPKYTLSTIFPDDYEPDPWCQNLCEHVCDLKITRDREEICLNASECPHDCWHECSCDIDFQCTLSAEADAAGLDRHWVRTNLRQVFVIESPPFGATLYDVVKRYPRLFDGVFTEKSLKNIKWEHENLLPPKELAREYGY